MKTGQLTWSRNQQLLRAGVMSWWTLLLTLFGLTSQQTHWGGLILSKLDHEEAIIVFLILLKCPLKALMLEALTARW